MTDTEQESLLKICDYWYEQEQVAMKAMEYAVAQKKLFMARYEAIASRAYPELGRLTLVPPPDDAA